MQFTGLCCCGLMINILNDQSPGTWTAHGFKSKPGRDCAPISPWDGLRPGQPGPLSGPGYRQRVGSTAELLMQEAQELQEGGESTAGVVNCRPRVSWPGLEVRRHCAITAGPLAA